MACEHGEIASSLLADWLWCGRSCHRVTDGAEQGRRVVVNSACIYVSTYTSDLMCVFNRCTSLYT